MVSGALKQDSPENMQIRRIIFSKNEKYMLIITKRWAQVVLILPKKLEPLGTIELGLYEDYFNQQTLETMHDTHSNYNHEQMGT